jgi:DNA-binding IclR family transcriptional regulator
MSSRAALAATRSLDILSYLATNPDQAFSLTELAVALDINPSSMFGIINAMADAGYVSRHAFQKTYRLGPVAAAVGVAALNQDSNLEAAADEVNRLGVELDAEAVVVIAVAGEMVTLACAGPSGGRFLSFVGQRVTHGAPVGSIFVAWSDPDVVDAWLERAEPELSDATKEQYKEVLGIVRQEGQAIVTLVERKWRFAVSPKTAASTRNDLLVPMSPGSKHRLYYVGVPVFDAQGQVLFGLFATGTSTKVTIDRVTELSDRLDDAATSVMNRIGGKAPKAPSPPTKKRK